MWPRDDFTQVPELPEREPGGAGRGPAAIAERARKPAYDHAMLGITVAGVVVALAAFIRDLVAG